MEMQHRIALVGIIVEDPEAVAEVNETLHNFAEFVIGRMGLPYRQHKISIISVVLDAPPDVVSTVSGKLGMISGVTVKSLQSKILD